MKKKNKLVFSFPLELEQERLITCQTYHYRAITKLKKDWKFFSLSKFYWTTCKVFHLERLFLEKS